MRCDGYCVGEFFCLGIATLKTGFMDQLNRPGFCRLQVWYIMGAANVEAPPP